MGALDTRHPYARGGGGVGFRDRIGTVIELEGVAEVAEFKPLVS